MDHLYFLDSRTRLSAGEGRYRGDDLAAHKSREPNTIQLIFHSR
jgi:hypothetical protein